MFQLWPPWKHSPLDAIHLLRYFYRCSKQLKRKRFYLFIFRGRNGERERNIHVQLHLARPLLGSWPATQAWALTGNQNSNPLVHRPALNPLSHTSQGSRQFELVNFDAFQCFCHFFVSPLPYWQNVSFEDFFQWGGVRRITEGEVRWIGRVEHGAHAGFGQKLLNTQCSVGRCASKSPIM